MLTFGSVFSGIGMLDYGLHLAGIEHAWFCEWDEWRRGILGKRWPGVPVYDDVRAVGAGCPAVDGIVGGFPCKGASSAGARTGFDHPETVLWREMWRCISELRPRVVLMENVANILAVDDGRVWGEVLGGLAALGYDVVWDCLPAAAVGAPHLRDRVFAVATYAASEPERAADHKADALTGGGHAWQISGGGNPRVAADPGERGREGEPPEHGTEPAQPIGHVERLGIPVEWGHYEPAIRRWEAIHGDAPGPLCAFRGVDVGAAARVERSRLSAIGDGVQVQVGYIAGRYILEREEGGIAA